MKICLGDEKMGLSDLNKALRNSKFVRDWVNKLYNNLLRYDGNY